jgi:hypothetical protein
LKCRIEKLIYSRGNYTVSMAIYNVYEQYVLSFGELEIIATIIQIYSYGKYHLSFQIIPLS